jgi:hypothetical protein
MQAYMPFYFATPVISSLKMLKVLAHFVICFLRENALAYSDAASSEEEKSFIKLTPERHFRRSGLTQREHPKNNFDFIISEFY